MKVFRLTLMSLLLVLLLVSGVMARQDTVVVYTSLETDETVHYIDVAREAMPDLNIEVLRLSTGELGARLLAERDNPQADLVFGWAVTNLIDFIGRDMLVPYKPDNWEKIPDHFKCPDGYWTAIDLYAAAFAVNTMEIERMGLDMPQSWEDLLDPQYEDQLLMPNPASSGTGFLAIASILVMMDPDYADKPIIENKGWDFLEALDKNMSQYIRSGSRPANMAASGEYAIASSFGYAIATLVDQGFPVEMVFPAEGSGYELEANALLKGARNPEGAKRFLDWALTEEAMTEYGTFKLGVTLPGISGPDFLPPLETIKLAPMDFAWQAEHREEILEIWQDKFYY